MSEVLGVNNADVVVAFSPHDELVMKIDYTIERALLAQQHSGCWHAAFDAHVEMNAEYRRLSPTSRQRPTPICADLTGRVLGMMGKSAIAPTIRSRAGR